MEKDKGSFVLGETPRALDQFFTAPNVAADCVAYLNDKFPLAAFSCVVEPSCGNMAFVNALQPYCKDKLLYMDIDSADAEHRRDFLTYTHTHTHTLCVGNPPFGKRAQLAVNFFNHAATFSSVIAFIVPRTFRKASITNALALDFEMQHEKLLDANSFLFEGKPYDVPCVFQIWVKLDNQRRRQKMPTLNKTRDFEFIPAAKSAAAPYDLVFRGVGVNAGRLFVIDDDDNDETKPVYSAGSHRFAKFTPEGAQKKTVVIEKIRSLNLEEHDAKYDVAGNPCLNATEICQIYNNRY
jgi:hypothetical protein